MNKRHNITIVGGIPAPIGGVTTFIFRLISTYQSSFKQLIDIYPGASKKKLPIRHLLLSRFKILRIYWLFLSKVRGPVYFNFSGAKGILLIAILPKVGASRWAVTLHNGDLESNTPKNPFLNWLVRRGVRKCDFFGVLSSNQREYFSHFDVLDDNIYHISSFIPIDISLIKPPPFEEFIELFKWVENGYKVFVISGYPTKIYQHLQIFNVFKDLWKSGVMDVRLVGFFYGDDSDGIKNKIEIEFEKSSFSQFFWGKSNEVFLSVLKMSSAYIRMNTVDSYGVAVAEALSLGKPVLATDVCERYPGADIISPHDFNSLREFIINIHQHSAQIETNNLDYLDDMQIFLNDLIEIEPCK